jgi:hypothetical protein
MEFESAVSNFFRCQSLTMKGARSALRVPLALWERAGVRETAMASSAFHDSGWRWSPGTLP